MLGKVFARLKSNESDRYGVAEIRSLPISGFASLRLKTTAPPATRKTSVSRYPMPRTTDCEAKRSDRFRFPESAKLVAVRPSVADVLRQNELTCVSDKTR